SAPTFTAIEGTIHNPMVQEWNLQIQREIGSNSSVMLNYVGNKGDRYPYTNGTLNMWDKYGSGGGVAAAPADPSYNTVEQVQSGAISNYNGLTTTLRHRFSSN